jgi:NTE family protein
VSTRRSARRPRLGLALGSGAARGWAHIGVVTSLVERGFKPEVVAGASVGALVAAAYATGRLAALEKWVSALTQRDVWRLVDTVFRGGGVMTGNRLMTAIATQIGDPKIEDLPVAFGAVATDLYTGEEIWLREGSVMTAIRASSGLPGLFAPSWHADRWLIDGGVVNPVPVSLCRALGADAVIAVDLSRPVTRAAMRAARGGATARRAGPAENTPPSAEGTEVLRSWSGLIDGLVESFRARRSEPGLFEVMASAVGIMQERITRDRLAADPPDVVLKPDLSRLQLMDFHRARESIDTGRKCVETAEVELSRLATRLKAGSGGRAARKVATPVRRSRRP